MDTRTLTLTGTAKARRTFLRANNNVTMKEITVKGENNTESKAVEMLKYISHTTVIPAVETMPNPKYRRHGKCGAPTMRKAAKPGTVNILCAVSVVPVVHVVETVVTPDSIPAIA
jgi:hypothetical protein